MRRLFVSVLALSWLALVGGCKCGGHNYGCGSDCGSAGCGSSGCGGCGLGGHGLGGHGCGAFGGGSHTCEHGICDTSDLDNHCCSRAPWIGAAPPPGAVGDVVTPPAGSKIAPPTEGRMPPVEGRMPPRTPDKGL